MNEKDLEILKRYRDCLKDYSERDTEQYEFTRAQLEMRSGKQWDERVASQRESDGRPTTVTNMVHPLVCRVVNPIRKNPLVPKITLENPKITKLVQGKIRDIDTRSRAKEAIEQAFETQVAGGMGYIVVKTDYVNSDDLNQEIKLEKIDNPSQCWLGYHKELDGSDARDGVEVNYIPRQEAVDKWGEEVASNGDSAVDIYTGWHVPSGYIMDSTWYERVEKSHWRYFMEDGQVLDEIPEGVEKEEFMLYVANKRRVSKTTVECYRIVGQEIVERTSLPIKYIPIVPFYGDRLYLEETQKRKWAGLTYWVWDSQRTLNYYKSNELELVSKAPKAPWLLAEGQEEGHEEGWENANTSSDPYIMYKPTTLAGQAVPAPMRMDNQAQTQGLMQSAMQVSNDMGAQVSISDGMLGMAQSANESASAVFQRNVQGEIGTIQYIDNAEQSLIHAYRIVLELIPYVHDTPQKHALRDEKGNRTFEQMNFAEILTDQVIKDAEIQIKGGPMTESKRRADMQSVLEVAQMFPEKMQEATPKILEMMDLEGGEELIGILGGGEGAPDPQAMMALQEAEATIEEQEQMLAQAEEHIKQMNNYIIAQEQERKNDLVLKQMDSETKLAQTELQNQGKLEVEALKQAGSANAQDKDIAQETRKNIMELAKETISENNSILENRELTENDNIGMPSIVTSAPDVQIEVETE